MVDIIILFLIGCVFYGGFFCGAKYKTFKEFVGAGKRALAEMLR